MNAISREPERHEIEALLPWHAAGTLNRRDADRVEQALAGDRELSRRYDLVREELVDPLYLNAPLGEPPAKICCIQSTSTRGWVRRPRVPWRSCLPRSTPRRRSRRAASVRSISPPA